MRRRGEKSTAGVVGAPPAAVIAFDEMRTYRQARQAAEFVGLDGGGGGGGRQPAARLYGTYAYRVYGWLPADRHQVGKGGAVNWNEGLHSWCRGQLNRLHRRTKGYTKSVAMLGYSPALLLAE